jgi:hypothetical protein
MPDDTQRQLDAYATPLARQLLEDCEVMARFAAANGTRIPEWLGNALAKIGAKAHRIRDDLERLQGAESDHDTEAIGRLQEAVGAAVRTDLRGLVRIHGILAEIVAPATPRSIRVTAGADTLRGAIRKIPLIGHMLTLSIFFLITYILVSVFGPILAAQEPWPAVAHFLTLLSGAGLGATFWALFTAHRYVVAGTYDPRYTIVYWTRLCLGLISGVILGAFVFTRFPDSALHDGSGVVLLSSSLAALLGGYSADAVNRILHRLVETLVTLVRGDGAEIQAARERELSTEHHQRLTASRTQTAIHLLSIREMLAEGNPSDAAEKLAELAHSLSDQPREPE